MLAQRKKANVKSPEKKNQRKFHDNNVAQETPSASAVFTSPRVLPQPHGPLVSSSGIKKEIATVDFSKLKSKPMNSSPLNSPSAHQRLPRINGSPSTQFQQLSVNSPSPKHSSRVDSPSARMQDSRVQMIFSQLSSKENFFTDVKQECFARLSVLRAKYDGAISPGKFDQEVAVFAGREIAEIEAILAEPNHSQKQAMLVEYCQKNTAFFERIFQKYANHASDRRAACAAELQILQSLLSLSTFTDKAQAVLEKIQTIEKNLELYNASSLYWVEKGMGRKIKESMKETKQWEVELNPHALTNPHDPFINDSDSSTDSEEETFSDGTLSCSSEDLPENGKTPRRLAQSSNGQLSSHLGPTEVIKNRHHRSRSSVVPAMFSEPMSPVINKKLLDSSIRDDGKARKQVSSRR